MMKNNLMQKGRILGLIFVTGVAITACKKDQQKIQEEAKKSVQDGTWKVTRYVDDGEDETSDYSGYVFNFNEDGTLSVTRNAENYGGTWSITNESSDDNPDGPDFNILINATNKLEDLNDDWEIQSQSNSKFELFDISGGNGGTDYLTLEKI